MSDVKFLSNLAACVFGVCFASQALPDTGTRIPPPGSYSDRGLTPKALGLQIDRETDRSLISASREMSPRRRMILARLQGPTSAPTLAPVQQASFLGPRIPATQLAGFLDLIASVEAGPKGYDAVQLRARIKPPKAPSQLTIGEIFAWIEATPRQQHAIGRYQIIPSTLRALVRKMGISPDTRFSPQVQDAMAISLLLDAGLREFESGKKTADEFMDRVAWIWAGLPLETGRSAYHGFNGNYAVISRGEYKAAFDAIFSLRRHKNVQSSAGP